MLRLLWQSRMGKTHIAKSLFGEEHTLAVNCQGPGSAISSLREVHRSLPRCVLFDEIHEQQVLQNKVLFQAGSDTVQLGQSPCGGFRYESWPSGLAFVPCSDKFAMSAAQGVSDPSDEDWLRASIIVAQRSVGDRWYVDIPGIAGGARFAGS